MAKELEMRNGEVTDSRVQIRDGRVFAVGVPPEELIELLEEHTDAA